MAKFSIEISDRAKLAEAEHSERAEIGHILHGVANQIGDGTTRAGDIKSRSGAVIGSWFYGGGN